MKKKKRVVVRSADNKNCVRVGPEGQTRTVDSTLCNAGLPPYQPVFMISSWSNKVSMKKGKRKGEPLGSEADFILKCLGGECANVGQNSGHVLVSGGEAYPQHFNIFLRPTALHSKNVSGEIRLTQ